MKDREKQEAELKAADEAAEDVGDRLESLIAHLGIANTMFENVSNDADTKLRNFEETRARELDFLTSLNRREAEERAEIADIRLRVATKCQDWIEANFEESAVIDDINDIEATKWKRVSYNISTRNSVDAAVSLASWALGEMGFTWNMPGPAPSQTETRRRN